MNFLIWNVRGLNDPLKQKEVVGRVRELKINLVCLIETRVKENKMNAIISRHFQGWQMVHNYSEVAHNGRIWLLWNGIQVDLVVSMDQSISCSVLFGTQRFYLSVPMMVLKGGDFGPIFSLRKVLFHRDLGCLQGTSMSLHTTQKVQNTQILKVQILKIFKTVCRHWQFLTMSFLDQCSLGLITKMKHL